jgi:hypothetical protein
MKKQLTKTEREQQRAQEHMALLNKVTDDAHRTAREQNACETCRSGHYCLHHS